MKPKFSLLSVKKTSTYIPKPCHFRCECIPSVQCLRAVKITLFPRASEITMESIYRECQTKVGRENERNTVFIHSAKFSVRRKRHCFTGLAKGRLVGAVRRLSDIQSQVLSGRVHCSSVIEVCCN